MLGLARRAGRAAVGTRAVISAARAGRLDALIVARDASESAVARLPSIARAAPVLRCGTRASLGAALGRDGVAVVGITDAGLAARIAELAGPAPERGVPASHEGGARKSE